MTEMDSHVTNQSYCVWHGRVAVVGTLVERYTTKMPLRVNGAR